MPDYLVETHAHTSEVSRCARCYAPEFGELFAAHGYSTVFLTNHFTSYTFLKAGLQSWNEWVDYFLRGYELAAEAAKGRFRVILGMEICFDEGDNDYLIYGITEKFLRENEGLTALSPKTFYPLAKENGLLVVQAHPFRFGMTLTKPDYLDGYEVFNGNPRHNSNNEFAALWAKKYEKLTTAGSDFHQPGDCGASGMIFNNDIRTNEDFITALKKSEYRFKHA